MKKIFITGANGFIGANLANQFLGWGYDIHALVRRGSDLWRLKEIKKNIILHRADLSNSQAIRSLIKKIRPDIIFHCAAYWGHQNVRDDFPLTFTTNFIGTVNLLMACKDIDFSCFIHTGSSSEYGEKNVPMNEHQILEPNNPYGVTKAAATMYANYFAHTYNKPIITLRLFSPYGYYDDARRLIPRLIIDSLKNRNHIELNSSSAVRDFVFIEDVIAAYRKAIPRARTLKGGVFNIGNGSQVSVKEVVASAARIVGQKLDVRYTGIGSKQYEPRCWMADITMAKKYLNWTPKYDFSRGLNKTIQWFRSHINYY